MSKAIKIRKGLNISLEGEAEKVLATAPQTDVFAVKPPDFHGVVPKLIVKEGEEVKAGSVLFYDKYNEKIKYTSPVSGEVASIVRGEKRRIMEIKILADKEVKYTSFPKIDPNSLSRQEVIDRLLESGTWPFIRQRPFDVIANPEQTPKAIFISGFSSAPLAPDNDFIFHGKSELFQTGLDAIAKLTEGKVHLTVRGGVKHDETFTKAKNVQLNSIKGPHPAGNVGVQIHHIDPINKGEVAWVINPQDVLAIGTLFKEGKYDASRIVALTGSEAKNRKYYKTFIGTSMKAFLEGNQSNNRVISGNVLTGSQVGEDGFLGFYDTQVTVVPEGNEPQFFLTKGWLGPGFDKYSMSRTFPTYLNPNKKYTLNTNLNGEERAFVMTGQYEKVFPFDILPVYLVKSIITNEIEKMENFGIYEVAPEDFALCEYVCTSKINVQEIIRTGLDELKKETT